MDSRVVNFTSSLEVYRAATNVGQALESVAREIVPGVESALSDISSGLAAVSNNLSNVSSSISSITAISSNLSDVSSALSGLLKYPTFGLTSTGTTQADAFQMTGNHAVFTTVPVGSGVKLPANPAAGEEFLVAHFGPSNNIIVYPPVGGRLLPGLAINAGLSASPNTVQKFMCVTSSPLIYTRDQS